MGCKKVSTFGLLLVVTKTFWNIEYGVVLEKLAGLSVVSGKCGIRGLDFERIEIFLDDLKFDKEFSQLEDLMENFELEDLVEDSIEDL